MLAVLKYQYQYPLLQLYKVPLISGHLLCAVLQPLPTGVHYSRRLRIAARFALGGENELYGVGRPRPEISERLGVQSEVG